MTRSFLPLVCGFQCEFCESVQPAWCMQVLMEFLYFLQSSHLCLSFWSHAECDEASSGNSVHRVCVLPSQQAHPGFLSAWGMSCWGYSLHSPCPTQRLNGSFRDTYKPTSVFDASANSRWAQWLLTLWWTSFHGVQRRINEVASKDYIFFGWLVDIFSSLKFGSFFHCFTNNLLNKVILSFVSTAYWIKEEAFYLRTSRFFICFHVLLIQPC